MRLSLPIPTASGGEYTHADKLFDLLKAESAGHYLLGKSNFWHGGVHFTDKTIPHCKDKHMIRCMGDGEVVAYRLLSDYKQSYWQGSALKYSSGFCLVRHTYRSPENTSDGPKKGQKNQLTFFSLYMHLAAASAYPAADSSGYRIKIKASNLRVRDSASLTATAIGSIDNGAELDVQALKTITDGSAVYLFARAILRSKTIRYTDTSKISAPGDTVWLAIRKTQGNNTETFAEFVASAAQAVPSYWQCKQRALLHKSVNIRSGEAEPGQAVRTLPIGSEVEYDPASAKKFAISGSQRLMARGTLTSDAANANISAPETFWICIEPEFVATRSTTPTRLDQVVTCSQVIKAGDPIGFMGLHETAKTGGGKHSKHQVHVEIFSADPNLKNFLKNKAEIKQGAQYLKLPKGTPLHSKSTGTPPTFTASSQTLQHDCTVPVSDCKKHKDTANADWYEIKVKDGTTTRNGCIAASAAETVSQHDWEKLGFKTIEAPMDFDGHLDTMASQPFYKNLYQAITGEMPPPDRERVREVLTGPAHQPQWSKIVALHPSEWKANSDSPLWSVLNLLLHKAPDRHAHEKERIDNCIWWDDVTGSVPELPANGVVWHWNVGGMLAVVSINKNRKWKIGTTSARFETGGRGPGTISTGRGDHGGVSYGSYQLSSNMGRVQSYVSQSEYKTEFDGLIINSELFKKKWKEIAEREAEAFNESQHDFIRITHYDVQIKKLKNNKITFDHKRAAIHDMVWSTSVQYGPETKIIINALKEYAVAGMTDKQIVEKVQQYKYDNTEILFSSSPSLWSGLRSRAEKEKKDLLSLVVDVVEIE